MNQSGSETARIVACVLADEAATLALGSRLAPLLEPGALLTLQGELGAGKTTLVRGLLRALGWAGTVRSPTYTLVEHYEVSRLDLYHFDLYRFKDASEWFGSGLDETGGPRAIRLIEWPDRAAAFLPPADLDIQLSWAGGGREASLRAHSLRGRRWLDSLGDFSPQ